MNRRTFFTSLAAAPAAAQQASDERARIVLDVARVNMLFAVTDKKGRFVTNLTKDDFEIKEEKKEQQILEFVAESDLPLRLGILVDSSNSVRDRFKFQQEAAVEFVNSVVRPDDKAVVAAFESNGPMLDKKLGEVRVEAVQKAVAALLATLPADVRKKVVGSM
jgi:hypothetical protein